MLNWIRGAVLLALCWSVVAAEELPVAVTLTPGEGPFGVQIGDLDQDGLNDVIVVVLQDKGFAIHFQNGPGQFNVLPDRFVQEPSNKIPSSVAIGDLNDDGVTDFASGSGGVYLQDRLDPGQFDLSQFLVIPTGFNNVAIADLNGDSLNDLALATTVGGESVRIHFQDSVTHLFPPDPDLIVFTGAPPDNFNNMAVDVGDVNNDGMQDVLTADRGEEMASVFLQGPPGMFGPSPDLKIPYAVLTSLAVGDLDDDGLDDLALRGFGPVNVHLQSGGGLPTVPDFQLFGGSSPGVAIGDFNDDGLNDVANRMGIHLQGFGDQFVYTFPPVAGTNSTKNVAAGDLNGDRNDDVAITLEFDDQTLLIFTPFCGDGGVNPGEECDDGGASANCDDDCTFPVCGDGNLNPEAGEDCDDGNNDDGDGCSANCEGTPAPGVSGPGLVATVLSILVLSLSLRRRFRRSGSPPISTRS